MDIQKEHSTLEQFGKVFCKSIDLESDRQETLPAYCEDIYRVIKCASNSYITSADISYNEIKIFGKTEICLTYYNQNSNICYVDFDEEFTKTVSVDNLSENACVRAQICNRYTNYRVINQRRIDVHSSCIIQLCVYDKTGCQCIKSCERTRLKSEKIKTADYNGFDISRIEFDEEFSIPSGANPIGRIISNTAYATTDDIRIIKDKMLVKAAVNVKVLYTPDGNDENEEKAEHTFSVTKIIERAGINEGDIVIPDVKIGNIYFKAKSGGSDKLNVISVFGELAVNTDFISEKNVDAITDGYAPGVETVTEYADYYGISDSKRLNENKQFDLSFDLNGDVAMLSELSVSLSPVYVKDGSLMTNASVTALSRNSSGEMSSHVYETPVSVDISGFSDAVASVEVVDYDYSLTSEKLNIRLTASFNAYCYTLSPLKLLSNIDINDETLSSPSLTVYFGKENEEVWNIAKSFSSDVDLIIKENDLKSNVLDTNKVLIIPRVQGGKI